MSLLADPHATIRAMAGRECRYCGARLSAFAGTCGRCGSRNHARGGVLGLVVVLLIVAIVGGGAVLLWQRPPSSLGAGSTAAGNDFAWLSTAMEDCDVEAARDPGALEFLVIPLKMAVRNPQEWRRKALNQIGNGILITAEDAIEGLKTAALSISDARYVFAVRDEATSAVYKWSQSVGIKKFISNDADAIE